MARPVLDFIRTIMALLGNVDLTKLKELIDTLMDLFQGVDISVASPIIEKVTKVVHDQVSAKESGAFALSVADGQTEDEAMVAHCQSALGLDEGETKTLALAGIDIAKLISIIKAIYDIIKLLRPAPTA